jgi:hypothetical protein
MCARSRGGSGGIEWGSYQLSAISYQLAAFGGGLDLQLPEEAGEWTALCSVRACWMATVDAARGMA